MKHEMPAVLLASLSVSLAVSLLATLLATSLALAQGDGSEACCAGESGFEARYYIRPIAQLTPAVENAPSFDGLWYGDGTDSRHGVLSMNSHGEVVGTMFVDVDPDPDPSAVSWMPHPFVWLPAPAYGLGSGLHDLMEGEPIAGYALDISDNGIVVGGAGAAMPTTGAATLLRAAKWEMPSIGCGGCLVPFFEYLDGGGTLPLPGWSWTMATAVDPAASGGAAPRIVGAGRVLGCTSVEMDAPAPLRRMDALHFDRGTGGWTLGVIPAGEPLVCLEFPSDLFFAFEEWACDLAGPTLGAAGSFDWPVHDEDACGPAAVANRCDIEMRVGALMGWEGEHPMTWECRHSGPACREVTGVRSMSPSGIEDDGGAVLAGWLSAPISGGGQCGEAAAIWSAGLPFPPREELPHPTLGPGHHNGAGSVAQRWRSIDCSCEGEVVLGWASGDGSGGTVWAREGLGGSSTNFAATWAKGLLAIAPAVDVQIERVYDILPSGEILCLVSREEPTAQGNMRAWYAALLMAVGHEGLDRSVEAEELAAIVGAWGTTPDGWGTYDIAGDETGALIIDAVDLAWVVAHWGLGTPRLMMPLDPAGADALCFTLPGEACAGRLPVRDETPTAAVQRLNCAVQYVGHLCPEDFVEWAKDGSPAQIECKCAAMSAIMHQLEENSDGN